MGEAEMMDEWPFVSIIVPVYNGSRTIDALLSSLLALDYPADQHEILIVDNKSTEPHVTGVSRRQKERFWLSPMRIVWLSQPG